MPAPGQQDGPIAGINITPLVDVLLVLLVIFMITARLVAPPAVPLELPRAARTTEVQQVFSLLVPRTGRVLVDGVEVADDATLLRHARRAARGAHDLRAVINADGAVPHQRVIALLDLLRRAGIERVAFGARPLGAGGAP
ncbi:MAG: biopolymer transporter ExbD [Proteobacteria bacterium]|nr:biopolymer transporter ExbD [Pseudomonadota bacterium]